MIGKEVGEILMLLKVFQPKMILSKWTDVMYVKM